MRRRRTRSLRLGLAWGLALAPAVARGQSPPGAGAFTPGAQAAAGPARPEIQIMGRGLFSPGAIAQTAPDGTTQLRGELANFADSALNLGVRYPFARGYSASVTTGVLAAESSYQDIIVHRLYGVLHLQGVDVILGRLRLPTRHVMFSTLRDDDLLELTDIRNPYAAGPATRTAHYGTLAALHATLCERVHGWLYAEQLEQTPMGAVASAAVAQRLGTDLVYEVPDDERDGTVLDHLGAGARATHLQAPFASWIVDLIGSAVLHVRPAAGHFVEWRTQALLDFGLDAAPSLDLATQLAVTTGLRYVHRPERTPRLQASLVGGYRRTWFMDGGNHWAIVANVFYRLGAGVDLGLQYQEDRLDGALTARGFATRRALYAALIVSFDARVVNRVEEPATLLQLEHAHIP